MQRLCTLDAAPMHLDAAPMQLSFFLQPQPLNHSPVNTTSEMNTPTTETVTPTTEAMIAPTIETVTPTIKTVTAEATAPRTPTIKTAIARGYKTPLFKLSRSRQASEAISPRHSPPRRIRGRSVVNGGPREQRIERQRRLNAL